jgi:hypothetical protein
MRGRIGGKKRKSFFKFSYLASNRRNEKHDGSMLNIP